MIESEDLYAACGSTDTAVQQEAYRHLWEYLYRVAYQLSYRQPDATALAQDCAQLALVRVHEQRETCLDPKAFRAWARRIASNLVIDELRRRRRLVFDDAYENGRSQPERADEGPSPETAVVDHLDEQSLRRLLAHSPMSERSRRVVIGRYFDDLPDELLAQTESDLAGQEVRPSHIQVTRAKNIAKLREWKLLAQFVSPKP